MKKIHLWLATCMMAGALLAGCGDVDKTSNVTSGVAVDTAAPGTTAGPVELDAHSLGETVSTDILEVSLKDATFALYASSVIDKTYSRPIESASNGIFKTSKGHAFVCMQLEVKNTDRATASIGDTFKPNMRMKIVYGGETYPINSFDLNNADGRVGFTLQYSMVGDNKNAISQNKTNNKLLDAGKQIFIQTLGVVKMEPNNLNDEFDFIVEIKNSSGEFEQFRYAVTSSGKNEVANQEMSLDEAISGFTSKEGIEYFKKHYPNYTKLSGSDIENAIKGKAMHASIKYSVGTGNFTYKFESEGKIRETALNLSDKPSGYLNELTWSIDGNQLVIDSPKKHEKCDVYKVKDGMYLAVLDGAPYILLG